MATGIQRHPALLIAAALALLVAWAIVAAPGGARAADAPRRGCVLLAVIAAEPLWHRTPGRASV